MLSSISLVDFVIVLLPLISPFLPIFLSKISVGFKKSILIFGVDGFSSSEKLKLWFSGKSWSVLNLLNDKLVGKDYFLFILIYWFWFFTTNLFSDCGVYIIYLFIGEISKDQYLLCPLSLLGLLCIMLV